MSEQTNRKQRALSGWRRWIVTRTVVSCRLICSPSLNLTSNGVKSSMLRDEGGSDPSDETGFRSTESSFTNVWLQQVWIRSTHQHRPEVRREVHLLQYFTEEEDEDGYIRNKYKRFIFWVINCSVSKIAAWISWIKSSESYFCHDITNNKLLNNRQQNLNMCIQSSCRNTCLSLWELHT